MFDEFDGETAFFTGLGTLFVALLAATVIWLVMAMFVDHDIRGYYIGAPMSNSTCVYQDLPWNTDAVAYCSEDPVKTLDFMARANAALLRRK